VVNGLTVEQTIVKMKVKPISNNHWNKVRKINKRVNTEHDKLEESLSLGYDTRHNIRNLQYRFDNFNV